MHIVLLLNGTCRHPFSEYTHALLVQHYGLPNEAPVVVSLEGWNVVNVTKCV